MRRDRVGKTEIDGNVERERERESKERRRERVCLSLWTWSCLCVDFRISNKIPLIKLLKIKNSGNFQVELLYFIPRTIDLAEV